MSPLLVRSVLLALPFTALVLRQWEVSALQAGALGRKLWAPCKAVSKPLSLCNRATFVKIVSCCAVFVHMDSTASPSCPSHLRSTPQPRPFPSRKRTSKPTPTKKQGWDNSFGGMLQFPFVQGAAYTPHKRVRQKASNMQDLGSFFLQHPWTERHGYMST